MAGGDAWRTGPFPSSALRSFVYLEQQPTSCPDNMLPQVHKTTFSHPPHMGVSPPTLLSISTLLPHAPLPLSVYYTIGHQGWDFALPTL